jgi:hypothetical protein
MPAPTPDTTRRRFSGSTMNLGATLSKDFGKLQLDYWVARKVPIQLGSLRVLFVVSFPVIICGLIGIAFSWYTLRSAQRLVGGEMIVRPLDVKQYQPLVDEVPGLLADAGAITSVIFLIVAVALRKLHPVFLTVILMYAIIWLCMNFVIVLYSYEGFP